MLSFSIFFCRVFRYDAERRFAIADAAIRF